MARRHDFTIQDVPLVGGATVFDFVNTTGARGTPRPRERLHEYRDLLAWCERAGVLDAAAAARLMRESRRRPKAAAEAFSAALTLREDLYALLAPLATGGTPDRAVLLRVEAWFRRGCQARALAFREGRIAWTWAMEPQRLDGVLWPIVNSAEETLMSRARLKKCGECDWLFIDASRNAGRLWCKKRCADRVRSRRYYRRRKGD